MADQQEPPIPDEHACASPAPARVKPGLIAVALVAAGAIHVLLPIMDAGDGSDPQVRAGLAILVLAGVLWLTEAVPLAITALLIPVVGLLGGVFRGQSTPAVTLAFANFAHPLIFLFLGGFGIAAALSRQGIDRWIADRILLLAKGHFRASAYGLFTVAAVLSAWISNTATVALLLPVALGILADLRQRAGGDVVVRVAPFLLLGVAYSASVGGIASKVGSPPNGLAADALGLTFAQWLAIGLPCVAILLPTLFVLLGLLARPGPVPRLRITVTPFAFTGARVGTLLIFLLAIVGWLCGGVLAPALGITKGFDSLVAIGALVLLAGCGFVNWRDIDRTTEWGVLLLFGGGLTLSKVLGATGASRYLADQLVAITGDYPVLLLTAVVVLFVIFLTELSSNTATAALFIPIFHEVALNLGMEPSRLVLPLAVAASCAFMLPVATPPNAIVFGSGQVPQRTMMRIGLVLNLTFAAILTLLSEVLF